MKMIPDDDPQWLVMRSLVGHKIVATTWIDAGEGDWGHHEEGTITLDDGRTILLSSYGHDADGAYVEDITAEPRELKRHGR